mmetsp:Transcript_21472/g.59952  ORF Transcript_21472/g.59952 Transcript_21472/m.59952 type:complete len:219 (+) Transcript_21472:269-925(+)
MAWMRGSRGLKYLHVGGGGAPCFCLFGLVALVVGTRWATVSSGTAVLVIMGSSLLVVLRSFVAVGLKARLPDVATFKAGRADISPTRPSAPSRAKEQTELKALPGKLCRLGRVRQSATGELNHRTGCWAGDISKGCRCVGCISIGETCWALPQPLRLALQLTPFLPIGVVLAGDGAPTTALATGASAIVTGLVGTGTGRLGLAACRNGLLKRGVGGHR